MSLREEVQRAVEIGTRDRLEKLVSSRATAVRYLLGMTYQDDERTRETAALGIAIASRYHRKLVQNIVRRLVWAMNDESGTNSATAPTVLLAIAGEAPELLLPMVPDLTRLAADEGLHEGLASTLKKVREACPGQVGERLTQFLNSEMAGKGCYEKPDNGS